MEHSWGSLGNDKVNGKGKKRTYTHIHSYIFRRLEKGREIKLDSKGSQPEQVSWAPGRGCGIQMWTGKAEGEGRPGRGWG